MPVVSQEFIVKVSNDPAKNVIDVGSRAMYLDMLLSNYYGKMVRQGSSFCINGIQASLRPSDASVGIDTGLSVEVGVDYVPVTQHSKTAWNNVFRGWRSQKNLQNAIGTQIRYDDLEFGWNKDEGKDRARTSTIFGQGMSDNTGEKLVLVGSSDATQGTNIGQYSLQDYYNSSYETPEPSRDPFTNTDIKDAKWGNTPFPEVQTLRTSATSSAGWFNNDIGGGVGLNIHDSAITIGDWQNLPSPAHSLCGVLYISAFVMPDDTVGQIEDEFIMTLSISVTSWKPLITRAKKTYRAAKARFSNRRKGVRKGRYYARRRRY